MNGYTKWEWWFLKADFFSMLGMALPSALVGCWGSLLGNCIMLFTGSGGLTVAAVIGVVTVVTLQIMARRSRCACRR